MFTNDANFSDMPQKAIGVYRLFVLIIHGFAAVTSFLFGYKFLQLFGISATIGSLSVDGILSGFVVMLLVDGMCLAMSKFYLSHADTPTQMRIAQSTYWLMLTISGIMSLVYLGAVIANYQRNLQPQAVEAGQWLIALVSVADLFIGAWYARSGSEFAMRLQTAKHGAAMAAALGEVQGEIQQQGRERARENLRQRSPSLASTIADTAVNGQLSRMQRHTPTPAGRLVPRRDNYQNGRGNGADFLAQQGGI